MSSAGTEANIKSHQKKTHRCDAAAFGLLRGIWAAADCSSHLPVPDIK
jgi:hypothetical protein